MCAGKALLPLAALLVVGAVVAAVTFGIHRPSGMIEPCENARAIIIADVHGMAYELGVR